MLIKQEIQTIQNSRYKFTAECRDSVWKISCYRKNDFKGFFKNMGSVMIISKDALGFRTLKAFKKIDNKGLKIKLLQLACKYMDEREVAECIY